MIEIRNLRKTYYVKGVGKTVANDINLTFPSKKSVGLFGRNGAGKSTLLRMIAGVEDPDSGSIVSDGTISWPVGFAGSFHPQLTGAQNTRFVARVYGLDTDELIAYVEEFANLGVHFHAPFRTYSSGMKSRLAFGVSMGIKFDTYLVDEVTSVGDATFRKRSKALLRDRIGESAAIVVSHSMPMMSEICDAGVVLIDGNAHWFDDVDEAIEAHENAMDGMLPNWATQPPPKKVL
ncbi:ABC transporter ATP-binding protein [uncultured Aliiroseovarius sp.]|uniref:ABC transporter ATP-binding protein n=1 Tax=uncultured Aliiroseovarius sp. TaxID=1658783 RepID=UPI0025983D48|nr:ABC transporter ATP-binding protein [uncultured Aliiroseovarius sp.]